MHAAILRRPGRTWTDMAGQPNHSAGGGRRAGAKSRLNCMMMLPCASSEEESSGKGAMAVQHGITNTANMKDKIHAR